MSGKPEVIYVVDDDDIYQFVMKKKIEKRHKINQIRHFRNGHEALEHLSLVADNSDQLPDVIFLDLNMPVMDGWDFLDEFMTLKARLAKKIQVYVVSSSIHIKDIERARKITDVTDYIIKPMNDKQLDKILVAHF